MICLKIKKLILFILFVVTDALYKQEDISISIESTPSRLDGTDYIIVKIGDHLKIWCHATEPIRGMRMETVNIDSYNPKFRQLVNITWQESLKWDPRIVSLHPLRQSSYDNHRYALYYTIKYVTMEHSGWQICYYNKYVLTYLYVYVSNRLETRHDDYKLIQTKSKTNVTVPCIAPTPNTQIDLLYSTNNSYTWESFKEVPNNTISKKDSKIGFQLEISTNTKFICFYYPNFYYSNSSYHSRISYIIDDDKYNPNPIFNEKYSAITHLGTDLKMECVLIDFKNVSSISFIWNTPILIKNKNKIYVNDSKIEVMANTTMHISSLTIRNVTLDDIGYYKCSAIDLNNKEVGFAQRQIFKKANETNKSKPIKYFNGTKISLKENDNCVLICEASYPITWTYVLSDKKNTIPKNVFIYSSLTSHFHSYQSILNINFATNKNNGFYYCHEMNTSSEKENVSNQKIFLYVLKDITTTLITTLNNITDTIYVLKYSPNVTFSCIPVFLNTMCIVYNGSNFPKNFVSRIEISPFHFEFSLETAIDEDLLFECMCTKKENTNHIYYTNYILIKTYESFKESTLPYINLKYNKNVTVGEELIINCTILRYCKQCTNNKRLNVNWIFNVNSTKINQRKNIFEKYILLYNAELYVSTLVIKDVQKTDNYEYECSVAGLGSKINVIIGDEKIIVNYLLVSFIVVTFVIITMVAFLILYIKQVKLQSKIRKAGLSNFNKGVKGILNPRIYINLQADMLPYDTKLEISRKKIQIGQQLGSGNFGIVFKGEIFGQFAGETVKTVAIKMVKRNLKYEYMKTLIFELKILCILGKHINVVNLLGACTENIDKMELLIILEYCHYGNIKDILRNNRNNFLNLINQETGEIVSPTSYINNNDDKNAKNIKENNYYNQQITTNTLLNWAYQISCGMEFIASRKVLHGDLAARNILLNEHNIVKICDFGLSKNLCTNYNYKKKTQCPLPIKWMAIESIRDKTFSTESDVWSFGIVLWELFSLAQTPYPNIVENMEFFQIINNGYRMEQPEYSTKQIYQMMLQCWEHNPKDRPLFSLITNFFKSVLEEAFSNHYLELSNEFETEFNIEKKYLETCF